MDIFDQYLLKELATEYGRSELTNDDYEVIYTRFCNLSHLDEAKPYLYVMRYFGLGTVAEPGVVLEELKEFKSDNAVLRGLFYDLRLCSDSDNRGLLEELRGAVDLGYDSTYLKDKSNVDRTKCLSKKGQEKTHSKVTAPTTSDKPKPKAESDQIEYITLNQKSVVSLLNTVTKEDYGTRKLVLPTIYNKIGECAFQGIKEVDMLIIPNGYVAIGANAFTWAIIHQVRIPDSVTIIEKNAFKGFTGVIECSASPAAFKYAKRYNIRTLVL